MSRKAKPTSVAKVRCAIYTRKSSEEGLDLEFNSLDAQRESSEAFIRQIVELDLAGQSLLEGKVRESDGLLYTAALSEFGAWETALGYATLEDGLKNTSGGGL